MNRPWSLARTPAFWIMLVPVALTGLAVLLFGVLQLFVVPRSTALAVPLSLAYGALWIVVLLRVADIVERRPAGLVALAVAWGGTVACAVGDRRRRISRPHARAGRSRRASPRTGAPPSSRPPWRRRARRPASCC